MRFITEMELRSLYKEKPFTSYQLKTGIRLTPGGRQFLIDQGVKIIDPTEEKETGKKSVKTRIVENEKTEKKKDWKYERLINESKALEALYYQIGGEYLTKDVHLAEYILDMAKKIAAIRKALKEGQAIKKTPAIECQGIRLEDFGSSLGDCFDTTDFHLKLERGLDIIVLHRLRCSLQQLQISLWELYEQADSYWEVLEPVIEESNRLSNSLSQKICSLIGGKVCQRKK